ncbi:MAG TPA: hypothetical protein VKG24_10445 [Pseudolabrys sp.]|nr:hypothetical protein [Pseudolabrys sp.]
MASHIERRKFLAALGGVAASWPLAARAQQPERMRRVGVLIGLTADDPESLVRVGALLQALQQMGWTDARNIRIEYRWGSADAERIHKHAAELVALAPDVILAAGTPTVSALQQMTRTSTNTASLLGTSTASSRAKSLPICPCRRRPNTSW